MTAAAVVITIIIINKTTALINVLHRSLLCSWLERRAQLCFYRSYKHWTRLPRAVVWAGFLKDLVLVFPTAMVRRGLPFPDPGRCEHHCPWDVQVPDVLCSSVFAPEREGSCLSLGKMIFYRIKKCAWGEEV